MEHRKFNEQLTIVPLLTKYVRGEELSALEQKAIETWIQKSPSNKSIFDALIDKDQLASDLSEFDEISSTADSRVEQLNALLDKRTSTKRWKGWFTAAAVLFAISVSSSLYVHFKSGNNLPNTITKTAIEDILPGKDQATLTFDDGKAIELKGEPIKTDVNGTFYSDGTSLAPSTVQYATLSTPRKGQYKAILSDGTAVWLNAQSKLKFPTQFSGKERLVELEGEGYFEVAHNPSKPFIVQSKEQRLKVLGTKFNVNSYDNEQSVVTTLVSGSVELFALESKTSKKLKPGQQGRLTKPGFDVYPVNTDAFTAWTSNEFHFEGTALAEALRQLERWYDIDVDYRNIPNVKVYGTISRSKKLSSVLYALERITDLQFKVIGRRIQIKE